MTAIRWAVLGLSALVLPVLVGGCGGDGGRTAYEAGRYEEALAAFTREVEAAGDGASAALHHDRALAALAAGEFRIAAASLAAAAARGGPEVAERAGFLLGNVAFESGLLAERQADTPEAEPFAYDVAIAYVEEARDRWAAAAMSRADWPEARRNVERALLELRRLEEKKARKERGEDPRKAPEPPPLPEPGGPSRTTEEEARPEAILTELSPDQVTALFDRLAAKEREKIEVRRAERRARSEDVEKDW